MTDTNPTLYYTNHLTIDKLSSVKRTSIERLTEIVRQFLKERSFNCQPIPDNRPLSYFAFDSKYLNFIEFGR